MHNKNGLQAEFDRLYRHEGELMTALRSGGAVNTNVTIRDLTIVSDKLESIREKLSAMAAEADRKIWEGDEDEEE